MILGGFLTAYFYALFVCDKFVPEAKLSTGLTLIDFSANSSKYSLPKCCNDQVFS
jgi:hypothetical protein